MPVVLGIGQLPVSDYQDVSAVDLAIDASNIALRDAEIDRVDAVFIGSMLSSEVCGGSYLGPPVAMAVSDHNTESFLTNAACASGAAVVRQAEIAIRSREYDTVLAVGVEKMCGPPREQLHRWLASAADPESRVRGTTFVEVNAMLMETYLQRYGVTRESFSVFSQVAHANASTNPFARLRKEFSVDEYLSSRVIVDPLRLYDCPCVGDGAAAVVIGSDRHRRSYGGVRIASSAWTTDTLGLQERNDPLHLGAVERSTYKALHRAGMTHSDIDLFELHDAFTIFTCLILESSEFVPKRRAAEFARTKGVDLQGTLPISTMGGLKARGHPVGASGTYQVVDAVTQLRGDAGPNQVSDAKVAMTQSMGGNASTVITMVLESL